MDKQWSEELLEQMPTPELQALLREDLDGSVTLSAEQLLCICRILADRAPTAGKNVQAAWNRFLSHYL